MKATTELPLIVGLPLIGSPPLLATLAPPLTHGGDFLWVPVQPKRLAASAGEPAASQIVDQLSPAPRWGFFLLVVSDFRHRNQSASTSF